MSLTHCPECKKEISDKAFDCPHCGCPRKKRSLELIPDQFVGKWSNVGKGLLIGLILLFVLFILLGLLF
jgi:hypothetical protein